ncbi:MAG: hypothetical protein JXR76_02005 [Deltaproteobacteria bacterium]|nr:hypothetical protein [Deltaproteobacteria bacterium]
MAAFFIDISGKSESAIWANRLKNDSFEDFAIESNPDFGFEINDVDSYSDLEWSGQSGA